MYLVTPVRGGARRILRLVSVQLQMVIPTRIHTDHGSRSRILDPVIHAYIPAQTSYAPSSREAQSENTTHGPYSTHDSTYQHPEPRRIRYTVISERVVQNTRELVRRNLPPCVSRGPVLEKLEARATGMDGIL